MAESKEVVKPDEKGRVTLKRFVQQGLAYTARREPNGRIILDPVVVLTVPASEAWLFRNARAMADVRAGIEQAGRSEVKELGDFSQYAADDDE